MGRPHHQCVRIGILFNLVQRTEELMDERHVEPVLTVVHGKNGNTIVKDIFYEWHCPPTSTVMMKQCSLYMPAPVRPRIT
jgi:hypothetical protein